LPVLISYTERNTEKYRQDCRTGRQESSIPVNYMIRELDLLSRVCFLILQMRRLDFIFFELSYYVIYKTMEEVS
jgi:hypothetical protein